jgi:hypothetical protein
LVAFFFAIFAKVIAYQFSLNKIGETFNKIGKALDLKVKSIEWLLIFEFISTILANYLWRRGSSVDIIENVLERSVFDGSVNPIKDNIKEFLSILLNTDVDWLTEAILERETESNGVIILSITHDKETEHSLYLMKQIVVDFYVFLLGHIWWLIVFHCK